MLVPEGSLCYFTTLNCCKKSKDYVYIPVLKGRTLDIVGKCFVYFCKEHKHDVLGKLNVDLNWRYANDEYVKYALGWPSKYLPSMN